MSTTMINEVNTMTPRQNDLVVKKQRPDSSMTKNVLINNESVKVSHICFKIFLKMLIKQLW